MRVRLGPNVVDDWLDRSSVYTVLSVYNESTGVGFRLLGNKESTTPAIYPAWKFDILDAAVSPRWVMLFAGDGRSFSLEPETWAQDGFWNRFFERDPAAARIFEEELRCLEA